MEDLDPCRRLRWRRMKRMRITVFGATGAIGREVVEQAAAAGHAVHAFVRDPASVLPPGVDVTVGDLTDAEAVARGVASSEAVIWAVGATRNEPDQVTLFERGARNLVEAMKRHGARRLIALSGAGITVHGERKPLGARLVSAVIGRIVRHVVDAKRREYEVFAASDLDWTLVRPPRVVPGGVTGRMTAGLRLEGRQVTQGDVARFMVDQLADRTYVRAAPYISSGSRRGQPAS